MSFSALLNIIITLFLLIVCGFVCRKIGIINDTSSKGLSKLIISVGQPALIIAALNNAEYSEENLDVAWKTVVIGFAIHTFLSVTAFLICRGIRNFDWGKVFEFSLVFANCGFIGFPILDAVLGDGKGSFMGAFFVISFHLFLWTWGIVILSRGRDDIRLTVKKALVNYGTIPCLIGIALYLCKPLFTVPVAISTFLNYLSGLCTPVSVLVTGALIATMPLGKMFTDKRLYIHSAIKLLLTPMVVCVIAKLLGLDDVFILLCTVMAGMPSAATITMLGELYGIEPGYASETVGMTSVLTTGTLPLVMLFANWIIGI